MPEKHFDWIWRLVPAAIAEFRGLALARAMQVVQC